VLKLTRLLFLDRPYFQMNSAPRALSRRYFTTLSASSFTAFAILGAGVALAMPLLKARRGGLQRPPSLGTTFSQLQCRYMGLDYQAAFRAICRLGLDRVRLCCYWNELEALEGQFDFTTLDWLLDECDRHNLAVVLAVGMKVPRWPEFHFPQWLTERTNTAERQRPLDLNPLIADRTLNMMQQVVTHTRSAPAVSHWQIENEPFTQLEISAGRFLSPEFVQQEVELVRSLALPHQKILLTNAITLPAAQLAEDDRAFETSLRLADAVGVNVYTKVPAGNSTFYLQPLPPYWARLKSWQTRLTEAERESWVAEAQAEPWEPNQLVAMQQVEYPSSSPHQATQLVSGLAAMGYGTVMLWGCEYWYWHQQHQRHDWWLAMQELIASE
jgi:hypothetical protein